MSRALVLMLVVLSGCDDPPEMVDAGTDAGDFDLPDAGFDAGLDAGEPTCAIALSEQRVALDIDGPLTQIHPAVAFDGEAVWVTYVRPEPGGGNFDVWATRRSCGGNTLMAPFAVQSDPEGNDIDPAIAILGERVLIAWQTDDGTGGTDNLQIRYRLFARDGTPMGDDRTLQTTRMGTPITDNHLGVRLAINSDGFVAAGARALPELMGFSAYVQSLDADGELVGDALVPAIEMDVTQTNVAVAVPAGGSPYYAYDRDDGTSTQVYVGRTGETPMVAVPDLIGSSGADILATDSTIWGALAAETATGVDIGIFDLVGGRTVSIGELGRIEHSPHLATSTGGDAVAFFRQIRGFTNELLVASLTPLGDPTLVEIDVPAYQPALTHVQGNFWFVAYSIGTSPDFRLVGSYVELVRSP